MANDEDAMINAAVEDLMKDQLAEASAPAAAKDDDAEAPLEPPPGLSGARLRAWKRQQKILQRGSNRLDLLTGARDSVASASKKELEDAAANGGVLGAGSPSSPADDEEPQLARWEASWKKSAEKAPVRELEFKDAPPAPEEPSSSSAADGNLPSAVKAESGPESPALRQRRGKANADAAASAPASAGFAANSGKAEPSAAPAPSPELQKLLVAQTWAAREAMLRKLLTVVLALAGAFTFAQYGGLASVGSNTAASPAAKPRQASDEDSGFSVEFGEEPSDLAEALLDTASMNNLTPALGGGWLSVPIGLVLLRAILHGFFSAIGGYRFSLTSTGSAAASSGFPFSVLKMIPAFQQISANFALMQSILDDVTSFAVVFVSAAALLSIASTSGA